MKRRISITVDAAIVDRADELVKHLGETRSAFVERAMSSHISDALDSGGALRQLADRHAKAVMGVAAIGAEGGS